MTDSYTEQHQIDIFPWDDSFNTGVAEIDQQHKHLVNLLNKVVTHIAFKHSDASINPVIDELLDYAVYHFQSEESYWLSSLNHAPQTSLHRDSHNYFINRIHELKALDNAMSMEEWQETLLSFLASWLASHILESDKHMAFMVEATQSGMSLDDASHWADEQMRGTTKTVINVIIAAYRNLTASTLRLVKEIKAKNQTQYKLSASEHLLQQALEHAKIGYWSLPYQSDLAVWSEEMYSLFGLPLDRSATPETLHRIMHKEYHSLYAESIQQCFRSGQEHRVEFLISRPNDGEMRWIESRGRVTYNSEGTPDRISGFVQDITERKNCEAQITQLAHIDSLTGLPNRRLFFDKLRHAIISNRQNNQHSALLFLDIDDFKTINDSHGHEYGDILLKEISARIKRWIRDGDVLARFAGDEFVIILSGLDCTLLEAAAQANAVAGKLLDKLSQLYQLREVQYNSSVSIGIVIFGDHQNSESELLQQADIAMYKAKQSGKNSACIFSEDMQEEITRHFKLENDLRRATRKQEFELYFQPQIDKAGAVVGAEALIRWRHPKRGLIQPDEFISLAEKTGLIVPIGEWVLKTACSQLSAWQQFDDTRSLTLSVNVSYKQFQNDNFVPLVCQLIEEHKIERGKLRLELTESVLIDDMEQITRHMNTLRSKGVHFSLDDFGMGYSSLKYLKDLPLSQLKIDRSFIRDLESGKSDPSIVKTIISISDTLGLYSIAEGVETASQQKYLQNEGCSVYQGFLYSKPLPIKEFDRYLSEQSLSVDKNKRQKTVKLD
ncbi:bacteriohemerythrin [Vibrio sp. SCSIO 43137]|uniref:bacteriohemerythrin n=1 Tax=Vibrio sp. SCSIO 43137 TaxID=3021011 RepID=UPI0023078A6F|nr:bacteriohemerythrin [Vibrio sp. SCSIO 43137]WCE32576.1 bacteriohemerythrin [Vibrio sp. SCSIO 43137]